MTCTDGIKTRQTERATQLLKTFLFTYIHTYLKFTSLALQPDTDDTLGVNDNDSLSLTVGRCTAQQKSVNMLLIQVTETSKNTVLSSCQPMPKSS